jgi:hypothetical protein
MLWPLSHGGRLPIFKPILRLQELKKQNIIEKVNEAKLLIENKNLDSKAQIDSLIKASYPEIILEKHISNKHFILKPKEDAITEHDLYIKRKTWQYVGEGLVMMVLLFWGMLVIYSTFSKNIRLNKQQNNFLLLYP